MLNLYSVSLEERMRGNLSTEEKMSVFYHNLFDYPLTLSDLIKWQSAAGVISHNLKNKETVINKRGYYFLKGREGLIYKRLLRKRISAKKMKIAKKAAKFLSLLPGIKMVGVSGSLAMENSSEDSDIDFLIITKNKTLWASRLLSLIFCAIFNIPVRRSDDRSQRDKLCLNMWFDENDLIWPKKDRNIYTAHEILQVIPLVNKDKAYEKFILKNKWSLSFWPKAVKIKKFKKLSLLKNSQKTFYPFEFVESIAYWVQYKHMKHKITREVITKTRAIFHPQDWGKIILSRLSS